MGVSGGYVPHPQPRSHEGRGERLQHGWTGGTGCWAVSTPLTPGPSPKRGEGGRFRHGWTGGAQDDPSTGSGRTGAGVGMALTPGPSPGGRGERLQHGWTGGAPDDPSTGFRTNGGGNGIATSLRLLAMTVRAQDDPSTGSGRTGRWWVGAALTPGPSPTRGEGSDFNMDGREGQDFGPWQGTGLPRRCAPRNDRKGSAYSFDRLRTNGGGGWVRPSPPAPLPRGEWI